MNRIRTMPLLGAQRSWEGSGGGLALPQESISRKKSPDPLPRALRADIKLIRTLCPAWRATLSGGVGKWVPSPKNGKYMKPSLSPLCVMICISFKTVNHFSKAINVTTLRLCDLCPSYDL